MGSLAASELLDAWERGLAQPPVVRALALLAAARPGSTVEELARLSIGRRDAELLSLRERTFGTRLAGMVECPSCCEQLELSFDTSEITAAVDESPEELTITAGGRDVWFRLPDSNDVLAVAGSGDAAAIRQLLLQRCAASPGELSDDLAEAIAARLAEADPQADVQLNVVCPACAHEWQAAFDIVTFFLSEVHAWAHRTLRDVHRLASAYGWREADILALSPWRRQVYLELAGA